MKKERVTLIQLYISVFYVAALIISNVIASRQVLLPGGIEQNGALFIFPITYILSDILSEVFGYRASRQTCWLAFIANIFMSIAFYLICMLPAPVWFTDTQAFSTVLQAVPRITIASLTAFVLGDWLNDIIFKRMKGSKGSEGYALRAIISSFFGELVDSSVFLLIAFLGTMPIKSMIIMVPTYVILKVLYEIIFLPLNMFIMKKCKKLHEEQLSKV